VSTPIVPTSTPLPPAKPVRDLLEELLGRDVDVRPGEPLSPDDDRSTTLAVYVDDSLQLQLVGVADIAFAAYAGAAIGLVPAAAAKEAVAGRLLPSNIAENLYEVLNICASLLNADGVPHVRLHEVHFPGATPPPQAVSVACTVGRRLDLVVTIAGYGAGRFSFVGMP